MTANRCKSRLGLTLLEVLVSLALLSLFTAAAGRWLVGLSHRSESMCSLANHTSRDARLSSLLRDDLDAMLDRSLRVDLDQRTLEFVSCYVVPGDRPGWARVTWRHDDDAGGLVRTRRLLEDERSESRELAHLDRNAWSLETIERDPESDRTRASTLITIGKGAPILVTWPSESDTSAGGRR